MCLSTYMVNFIFHSFSFVIIIIHYLPSDPRLVNLFMIWPVLLSEEFWNEVFFLFYQNFFVILLFSLIWAHIKLKENSRFHAALTRKNFWFLYFFCPTSSTFYFASCFCPESHSVVSLFYRTAEAAFFSSYPPSIGTCLLHEGKKEIFFCTNRLYLCRWIQEGVLLALLVCSCLSVCLRWMSFSWWLEWDKTAKNKCQMISNMLIAVGRNRLIVATQHLLSIYSLNCLKKCSKLQILEAHKKFSYDIIWVQSLVISTIHFNTNTEQQIVSFFCLVLMKPVW